MHRRTTSPRSGWTFVEMLVAISLSAVFLGAAALVLSSINANSKRLVRVVDADIGVSNNQNFYGASSSSVRVNTAPNFGKSATAQLFRDLILEDADRCTAVYCLPRNLRNSIRPEFLRYEAGEAGSTLPRPRIDSPETFRQFLASVEPTSAGIYDTVIRNVPQPDRPNTTIYMLSPEANPGIIRVYAIYEIDFVPVSNVLGTYVSVRRYKNSALTHYYDVFFDSGSGDPFYPVFAAFEREARKVVSEGPSIDRFKVSKGIPFSLVWLPDPSINPYSVKQITPSAPANSPKQAYEKMSGKSSFLVALPMFPNL